MDGEKTITQGITENLDRSLIAIALIKAIDNEIEKQQKDPSAPGLQKQFHVIVDLNLLYPKGNGLESARKKALSLLKKTIQSVDSDIEGCCVNINKSKYASQHIFAYLTGNQVRNLSAKCNGNLRSSGARPIYKIWLDDEIEPFLYESVATIKADAALVSFSASGENICWAVIDSGIDGDHSHFSKWKNTILDKPLHHVDFTGPDVKIIRRDQQPKDNNGHGTHVAGIIAGELPDDKNGKVIAGSVVSRSRDDSGDVKWNSWNVKNLRGVAPKCKLVSLKVLDEDGKGRVSNIIAALGYVNQINSQGRWQLINGVNISVGYEFDAEWFACGQSPLCVEVNRLVRSGVSVVVAAGNTGYGYAQTMSQGAFKTGLNLTINDPGNAEHAITVGATHQQSPHTFGVSYFSSKGPTGDGRMKPDLVAPGERIVSCAAGKVKEKIMTKPGIVACDYREESGTRMAAPHVSGAIAALLSIRREFIGEPEKIKQIFLSTCTDLKRDRYFQGHGLVDVMRAIQSI